MNEFAGTVTPVVRLYAMGAGPFGSDSGKIKQTRILRVASRTNSPSATIRIGEA